MSFLPIVFLLSLMMPIVFQVGPMALMPHRLLLLLLFLPLFFQLILGKAGPLSAIDFAVLFSVVWATLSIMVSIGDGKVEAVGIYWIEFFGAYMVGRVCIRSGQDYIRFVTFYFVVMLVLLPFVVMEAVTHRPILLDLFPSGVTKNTSDPRFGLRRVQAVFSHPIHWGVFASCAFGIFYYALRTRAQRMLGVMLSGLSTFLSLSTGALLSVVVQVLFLAWEYLTRPSKYRWRLFAALAVLAYVTIDLLSSRSPFHVLVTYGTFSTGSSYNRILIWDHGTRTVADFPFFGRGLDTYNWERPRWMSSSVDNFWLLMAMRYGLPAVTAFALAVILIVRRASLANLPEGRLQACRAGFLISAGGVIISGGTVDYWHAILSFVMFFFGAAVWMTQYQADASGVLDISPENAGPRRSAPRYTRFSDNTAGKVTATDPDRDLSMASSRYR